MWNATLPPPLVAFAQARLGSLVAVHDVSTSGGNAATYRVRGAAGTAVLKAFRSERTFRQERHAYRAWTPGLPDTPVVLDARPAPHRALLLTDLGGRTAARASLGPEVERRLHARAGAWLRRLHALAHEDADPVSLDDAYRQRIDAAVKAELPAVDVRLQTWLRAVLADLPERMRGAVRTPCHLDFEPRNWLIDAGGAWLGVIDFEHARPDHPLADLARLAAYVWPFRPDLGTSFMAGYAGGADPDAARTVELLAVFEAAKRLSWAYARGDDARIASARTSLIAHGAPIDD